MELTIWRGTHEVGGTAIELKTKGKRVLLDAGYPLFFHGELIDDKLIRQPGQKLLQMGVIPDIKGLYCWDQPEFDAVVISHAHSDHFGLLKYIHPGIPVYCTETTKKLIELSLAFPIGNFDRFDWHCFGISALKEPSFSIGDLVFKAFPMDHSAYDAAAFEIKGEGKTILYTGDFRGHGRREKYLDRFIEAAEKGADLLLIEGTTLGRTGETNLTEAEIEKEAEQIMRRSRGIVLVQPASQNIDRIISFYHAAKNCGKIFVMDSYTANLFYELNKLGNCLPKPSFLEPNIRVFFPSVLTKRMKISFGGRYGRRYRLNSITRSQISKKQKDIVMMVRPSMLSDLKLMGLKNGDFIYSLWQVYRNKPHQEAMENWLKSRGFQDWYLHTSGHAFEPEIRRVIEGLDPKKIIPIHTFCPECFLDFSEKVEVLQDGKPIRL